MNSQGANHNKHNDKNNDKHNDNQLTHAEDYLPLVRNCDDEKMQFEFLKINKPGMALELAKSTLTTPRVLDILTRHPLITVRHCVAKNPNCSEHTLKVLSEDKDMLVRDYARRTLQAKA